MKKGLGKGLNALLPDDIPQNIEDKDFTELKITEIEPNKNQPRRDFNREKLEELAESIKQHGIIQPLVVVKNSLGMYTIVAGERRWRAAKLAGIKTVPAVIKDYSKEEIAQIALIENLQREDLNPIEEATGYRVLMEEYNMTQEDVSQSVGKSRSTIANSVRLLVLEDSIKKLIINGEISGGHARAVLSLPTKEQRIILCERIINEGLNVRQAENIAKTMQSGGNKKIKGTKQEFRIELDSIEDKLSRGFGTKVKISQGSKKGKIEIEYYNNKDFDRILNMFKI